MQCQILHINYGVPHLQLACKIFKKCHKMFKHKYSPKTFILFSPCIVNDYNLLLPTNAHYFTNIYFTLSGTYKFQPVDII
jgi:hypothetical protein